MKKHHQLSVLKEPIPFFLLLMNILFLLIILYLCHSQLFPEECASFPCNQDYPSSFEFPEDSYFFPGDFPV